jgi:predicted GNAT family acetyltransferase
MPVVRGLRNYSYLAGMFTAKEHRRRGIAGTVLQKALADDVLYGATKNVLLASTSGAHLYRQLRYRTLATLSIFTQLRK